MPATIHAITTINEKPIRPMIVVSLCLIVLIVFMAAGIVLSAMRTMAGRRCRSKNMKTLTTKHQRVVDNQGFPHGILALPTTIR